VDSYQPTTRKWEHDIRELRVRLLGGLAFMLAVTVAGTVGYHLIDPEAGWIRAFFMTAITLTTVGYGHEIALDSDGARIFTALLILVGMGGVLYFISTGTAFVLEGHIGDVFRRHRMERDLAKLTHHLIVCGSGATAIYAITELRSVRRPVVMVVHRSEELEHIREVLGDLPIVVGDPAHDDVLLAAGITRAAGVIACTDSDKENLVVTLAARQLNPDIRIVTRVQNVEQEARIRKVGADAVVSPNFIGGLRMASEMIRPTVVTFLDTMLRDRDLNLRIDEVGIPADSPAVGRRINELGLENVPHALLLAVRSADGSWQYNPSRSRVVDAGMVLIFLGSPKDARALCEQLGGEMLSVPTATEA